MLVAIGSTKLLALLCWSNKSCFFSSVNWETLRCTAVNTSIQRTGKVNTLDNIVPSPPELTSIMKFSKCRSIKKNLSNYNHSVGVQRRKPQWSIFPKKIVTHTRPLHLRTCNLTYYSQTHVILKYLTVLRAIILQAKVVPATLLDFPKHMSCQNDGALMWLIFSHSFSYAVHSNFTISYLCEMTSCDKTQSLSTS